MILEYCILMISVQNKLLLSEINMLGTNLFRTIPLRDLWYRHRAKTLKTDCGTDPVKKSAFLQAITTKQVSF